MKKIAFFCIPAHGHTNPMLPVAAEFVRRGNTVRFYSFDEFENKIKAAGAEFISCDSFLPKLTMQEEAGLKNVSTTEMTIQDIRITLSMNDFLEKEFKSFQPDVVYTDSVCFWGKLNAWKHHVPMVVSTSTFAFNQLSSEYMKNSPKEMADMIFGLPRVSGELKKLEPYGYHVKSALSLVQSDNDTDSIVYTSRRFQPYAESFSDHYAFVGPSVFSNVLPEKKKDRPLIYISMGTVINDRPDFYSKCIDALKNLNVDTIISCGNTINREKLGILPDNIQVYPYVDQLDVLARADAFITHCGMNSVSESLYMATPMVLYPQTGEQYAVARRVTEIGAGIMLKDDSSGGIRTAIQKILNNKAYGNAAAKCSADFRACSGTAGAAEFIENAPHSSDGIDIIGELNKANAKFQLLYWLGVIIAINLMGFLVSWKYVWIIGIAAGILTSPIGKAIQKRNYASLTRGITHSRS
ncbi:MAG: glycosyl transferase [Lachnospiraceae bacterium]|nr:glycosyl transferase [Lachnospiraceae bacterium]